MPAYVEPKKYGSDIAIMKKETDESSVIAFRATIVSELINDTIGEFLKLLTPSWFYLSELGHSRIQFWK